MNFIELVQSRYSTRAYSSKKVEKEKLDYILESARLAPSACNLQPWIFLAVTESDGMKKLCDCYPREWLKTAPMAIIVCVNHNQSWKRPADHKDHADIDGAIATEHICLAAAEQGLGSCWICNLDTVLCRKYFNIPSNIEPIAIIPIGYPAEGLKTPEKKRKELSDIIKYESF